MKDKKLNLTKPADALEYLKYMAGQVPASGLTLNQATQQTALIIRAHSTLEKVLQEKSKPTPKKPSERKDLRSELGEQH